MTSLNKLGSLQDVSLLRESFELECKAAQGASGQGEVPKDFCPTYSAMANAHGGMVILGIHEKLGVFSENVGEYLKSVGENVGENDFGDFEPHQAR